MEAIFRDTLYIKTAIHIKVEERRHAILDQIGFRQYRFHQVEAAGE